MDTDYKANGSKAVNISVLIDSIKDFEIMNLLKTLICEDSEKVFQDNEKIDHIYDGINLIRSEGISLYLMIFQHCYLENNEKNIKLSKIDIEHLFAIFQFLIEKPAENIFKKDDFNRIAFIIHDLYIYFNEIEMNDEIEIRIIHSIKEIGAKFKTAYPEFVIKICHILT